MSAMGDFLAWIDNMKRVGARNFTDLVTNPEDSLPTIAARIDEDMTRAVREDPGGLGMDMFMPGGKLAGAMAGIVKGKGGAWTNSARKKLDDMVNDTTYDIRPETRMNRIGMQPETWDYMPEDARRALFERYYGGPMSDPEVAKEYANSIAAEKIADWAQGPYKKYFTTSLGTADDPLRRLAGEGKWIPASPPTVSDFVKNEALLHRTDAGFPAVGQNTNERIWEDMADSTISPYTPTSVNAGWIPDEIANMTNHPAWGKENIHSFDGINGFATFTGVGQIPDHLYQMAKEGRLDIGKIPNLSMEGAYRLVQADKAAQDAAAKTRDARIAEIARQKYSATAPDYQTDRIRAFDMHGGLDPDELMNRMSLETCTGNHCLGSAGHNAHGYREYFPMRDPITGKSLSKGGVQVNEYMQNLMDNLDERVTSIRTPEGDFIATINELPGGIADDIDTWAKMAAHKYPGISGIIEDELATAKAAAKFGYKPADTIRDNLERLFARDHVDELMGLQFPQYLQVKGRNNGVIDEAFWPDIENYLSRSGPYSTKAMEAAIQHKDDLFNFRPRPQEKFAMGGLVCYKSPNGTYHTSEGDK